MFIRIFNYLKMSPILTGLAFLTLTLFLSLAEVVTDKESNFAWDDQIRILINSIRTSQLDHQIEFLTNFNGTAGVAVFSLIVLGILIYNKWFREIRFYLASVIGASILFVAIKYMVQRIRPSLEIVDIGGYSFPSGHTTLSTATSLALYFIFIRRLKSKTLKMLLVLICLAWPLMIAASRVYLDVHWLSDVLAGLGLGIFWVTVLTFFFKKSEVRK